MDRGPTIFIGVLFTFSAAWLGLVLAPQLQLGGLQPVRAADTGHEYPTPLEGVAAEGREIYRAYGCMYCHTQQVRAKGFGADQDRGWGDRRTVARDYIHDKPVFLGTMRTGPDLTNIGVRQPSTDWHHKHLYDPQITSAGSIMPPFAFLYERRKLAGEPSRDALKLEGKWAPEPGYEVVPTEDAKALVAYLLAQNRSHELKEAEQ